MPTTTTDSFTIPEKEIGPLSGKLWNESCGVLALVPVRRTIAVELCFIEIMQIAEEIEGTIRDSDAGSRLYFVNDSVI